MRNGWTGKSGLACIYPPVTHTLSVCMCVCLSLCVYLSLLYCSMLAHLLPTVALPYPEAIREKNQSIAMYSTQIMYCIMYRIMNVLLELILHPFSCPCPLPPR